MQLDWTINVGEIGSALLVLLSMGVYLGRLEAFMSRTERFFEESVKDRAQIKEQISARHVENVTRFARIESRLQAIVDTQKRPYAPKH